MAEIPETSSTSSKQHQSDDKAGDILRKERITRRITIETIAKDLKLNVNYIKSLENNKYDELPAQPYVRVYLRSIAQYLMLDPDVVLKLYLKERGIESANPQEESAKKISVSDEPRSKTPLSWFIVGGSILGLALLSFLSKGTQHATPVMQPVPVAIDTVDTALQQTMVPTDTISDSAAMMAGVTITSDTIMPTPVPVEKKVKIDSLKLVISPLSDSVWVQAFTDKKSWKSFLKKPRAFRALDSINIHIGNNEIVKYTLNGRSTTISGTGVVVFKIDKGGVHPRTMEEWNSTFGANN
jgi:cytoskeletal protein RodZ